MNILGLDTAQGACSAALLVDGHLAAHRFEVMRSGHAERLMGQVGEVLEEAGLAYADIDRIACTIGPGTFTGTRIALAAARGMALALKKPVIGITTLEALAASMEGTETRIAAFDAKRGELYVQAFTGSDHHALTEPEVLSVEDAAIRFAALDAGDLTIGGTGAELLIDALHDKGVEADHSRSAPFPDARFVAMLATGRKACKKPPAPFYLRAPDAKLPGGLDPEPQ